MRHNTLSTSQQQLIHNITVHNHNVWLQLGHVALTVKNTDTAVSCFIRALQINPNGPEALEHVMRSSLELQTTRPEITSAMQCIQSAIGSNFPTRDLCLQVVYAFLAKSDVVCACALLHLAVVWHANIQTCAGYWFGVGSMLFINGNLDKATIALKNVLLLEPNSLWSTKVKYTLGVINRRRVKPVLAIEYFDSILNNPPEPLTIEDILFEIGLTHEANKQFKLSKRAYQKILESKPHNPKVIARLGWLHAQQNSPSRVKEGIALLQEALMMEPSDADMWLRLSRVMAFEGTFEQAFESLRHALELQSHSGVVWCEGGCYHVAQHQFVEAQRMFEIALQKDHSLGEAWFNLGQVYEARNDIATARNMYIMAAKFNSHPTIARKTRTISKAAFQTCDVPAPLYIDLTNPIVNLRFPDIPEIPMVDFETNRQ